MNKETLSKVFAAIALIIFIAAIIGKLAFDYDPVTLVCAGGCVLAAAQIVKKQD